MHPLSKDEGSKNIGNNMSMALETRKSCKSIVVAVSYLVHYDTLLQNAASIIAKWDSYFIEKCDKSLLQNGFITKFPLKVYYKI